MQSGATTQPVLSAQSDRPRSYARPMELIAIGAVVGFDQLTKEVVRRRSSCTAGGRSSRGFLDLTHVQNRGAAFGLLNAADFPYKPLVMIGDRRDRAGRHRRLREPARLARTAGAVWPVADPRRRVRQPDRSRASRATSWTSWTCTGARSHFWAFNVADAAITVGAILVLLDMIGLGRQHASHSV